MVLGGVPKGGLNIALKPKIPSQGPGDAIFVAKLGFSLNVRQNRYNGITELKKLLPFLNYYDLTVPGRADARL